MEIISIYCTTTATEIDNLCKKKIGSLATLDWQYWLQKWLWQKLRCFLEELSPVESTGSKGEVPCAKENE